jgi:nitrogenase molybdenum-iron protein NifN
MISHYKEPIDIASSSFGESSAIYGGRENLRLALKNVTRQYKPQVIGVATTCLAETIGDDVGMFLRELEAESAADGQQRPLVVHVSTPSYTGTHADGYYLTVRAIVEQLAEDGPGSRHVNVFPAMFSPADLRYLQEVLEDFALPATILPDYSETLDGPLWDEYQLIPHGGASLKAIRDAGRACASIDFSFTNDAETTAAAYLEDQFQVSNFRLGLPIGVEQTDRLFERLSAISGRPVPARHAKERGRLLDSFVDGHKYVYGKRAAVYGEEDLVVGIAALLSEIGIVPAVCISGGKSGRLRHALREATPDVFQQIQVCDGVDFAQFDELLADREIDMMIGSSKGYPLARRLNVPLIRVGFPIHDRIGGSRVLHVGYRGAQQLFDRIANAVLERKQADSSVGYSYL